MNAERKNRNDKYDYTRFAKRIFQMVGKGGTENKFEFIKNWKFINL